MRKIRRLSPEIITYLMSFIGGVICCVLLFTFRGEQIIYNTLSKFIAIWLKTADKITLMSETQLILSAIGVVLTFIVIIYQLKSDYKIRT